MINVAIVEDDANSAARLVDCLERSFSERGVEFHYVLFPEATSFLANYRATFDLVFMDIELPLLNGMEAARRLREKDSQVVLVFITSMSHFAEKGYEVGALDFISKPYLFADLDRKLGRALRACDQNSESLMVNSRGTTRRLQLRDIYCIEVLGHSLSIRTEDEVIEASGTLRDMQNVLQGRGFLRCNKSFLVNGRFVQMVRNNRIAMVDGLELNLGRSYRKSFLDGLAGHISGEGSL